MPSKKTMGEVYYRAAEANVRRTSSPAWKKVAEKHSTRPGTAIGLARKWALGHNHKNPKTPVQWPLKARQRNQKRYKQGRRIYEALLNDPTKPISHLGGRTAERALYYFVNTDGPKPPAFQWPIPGRDRGAASGRARGGDINRMEMGEDIYDALVENPAQTLQQVANHFNITRVKANNDLALFVRTRRANNDFIWPIPGRRNRSRA